MRLSLVLLSCLLIPSAIAAQTPSSKQPANCTVQGQIIQQPGGQPIRKVNVWFYSAGEHQESEEQQYSAVTDADGRFRIDDVKPGVYRLGYDRPGFVDAEKRHHRYGMLFSLEPGQELEDLLFHMAPAAVITGKVTDIDGDPVPNVEVGAIPPHFNRKNVPAVSGGDTNDLGEYRISGLSPNRYLVVAIPLRQLGRSVESAKAGDKMRPVYGVTYYPGTTDRSQAIPLVLRPGDEAPVNIRLAQVRFFHVRGEVTDLSAGTTDAVNVVLRPLDESFMAAIAEWPVDKDGKFDIRGVLPGSYSVLLMFGGSLSPRVMRGGQTVQVINADVEGLRISPVPNGQVRGQFRMDNGQKVDWSSVNVGLYSDRPTPPMGSYTDAGTNGFNAMYWDERFAHAEVRSNGSFEIKDVPADTYRLKFGSSNKAFEAYFIKAVSLDGKDVTDSGFRAEGPIALDVVVSAQGANLEGVVLDDTDKPASDVQVVIVPDSTRRLRNDLYEVTNTDSHGHFSVHGLSPGEFRIFALDDEDLDGDEIADPAFVRTHESLGQTIQLKEAEHKNIALKLVPSND